MSAVKARSTAESLEAAQAAYDAGRFEDALAELRPLDATVLDADSHTALWRLRALASFRVGEMEAAAVAAETLLERIDVGADAMQSARFDVLGISVVAAGELARFDQSLAHLREMLALAARGGGMSEWVRARGTAANAFALLGDPWAGQRLLGELVGLFQGMTDQPRLEAQVRGNHCAASLLIARAARQGGDLVAADDALELAEASLARSREIAVATGDARIHAFADVHAAETAILRGKGADALALLQGTVAVADARGLRAHGRQLRLLEAQAKLEVGDPAGALARLVEVASTASPAHEVSVRIRLHAMLHDAHHLLGQPGPAREHLARSITLEQFRLYRQLHAQSRFLRTRLELEHLYRYRQGSPS